MGRGDRKTKKGKINIGSFGKIRPAKQTPATKAVAKQDEPKEKAAAPKKKAVKKAKAKEE